MVGRGVNSWTGGGRHGFSKMAAGTDPKSQFDAGD